MTLTLADVGKKSTSVLQQIMENPHGFGSPLEFWNIKFDIFNIALYIIICDFMYNCRHNLRFF